MAIENKEKNATACEEKPQGFSAFCNRFFGKNASWRIKALRTSFLAAVSAAGFLGSAHYPLSRPLTEGEKRDFQTVFKDSVDYGAVRIRPPSVMVRLQSYLGDFPLHALEGATHGNTITMSDEHYRSDYSTLPYIDPLMAVALHEMSHVWQGQNCPETIERGLDATAYSYDPLGGFDLLDYNTEQQADIIADFYTGQAGAEKNDYILQSFIKDPTYVRRSCPTP